MHAPELGLLQGHVAMVCMVCAGVVASDCHFGHTHTPPRLTHVGSETDLA